MTSERSESYSELGGQPHQLTPSEERALYNMGLGSREMRARIDREINTQNNLTQSAINHAGAEAIRQADIQRDKARGIDVNSVEYLAKLRIAERNRSRRS